MSVIKLFGGYSAWFSSSVSPNTVKQWNLFGGKFSDKSTADYLFSDSELEADTLNIYDTQHGVTIFRSSWITDVINCYNIKDVSLGDYILLPSTHIKESNQSQNITTALSPPVDFTLCKDSLEDVLHVDDVHINSSTRFIDVTDLPDLVIKKRS